MGSTKDKKASKEKRSSEEASKKTKRSQAMDIVESSAEEQISERKTKKRKSEAAGSADKGKKDKANKKDKTEKDKSAKSKDKKEKKDKKKSKKDKKSKKQSADTDTQSGSEPGSDADADADADIAVDAEMEGSDNSSTAEQPTQHSEDEPVPDGLQRFPDFSQEATISSSAAQEAARMGIPQWLAQPTTVDRDVTAPANDPRFGLSGHILGQCSKAGIDQLFAVQSAVIPVLRAAHSLSRLRQHVRDVCVSAPTGSGKTLAFVIPIVEKLRARVVVRLRALVVLPTKELAQQVKESFDFFCVGTDLRVGLATGDMSLGKEQAALVVGGSGSAASGGSSRVDILVCTPGRLLDHLAMTRGFTLQHLEFWVMDEADRLLGEAYQEWLPKVQAAIEAEAEPEAEAGTGLGEHGVPTADACTRRSALARLDPLAPPAPRVQKLLFSATLTRDPGKIARLKLVRPLYVAVTQPQADSQADGTARYAFPASLREFYAMCAADEKPLWLMWLLWTEGVRHGVCFTKSLETAHRLAQVMQAWAAAVTDWPEGRPAVVVAEYSSDLAAGERARIMRMFRAGEISMLICSDLIARGMDVDQISAVVNYDVPVHMSQYTHRVGRTARAGREGAAYTLVGSAQAFHFKKMMKENGHWDGVLRRVDPAKDVLEGLRGQYKAALERVGEIYGEIN